MKALIDRRYEIKRQMKALEDELKGIDQEIKDNYEPGEILLGSNGHGYRLGVTEKLVYPKSVAQALVDKGLALEFIKPSTAMLERLAKSKKIAWEEYAAFQNQAEVTVSVVIQEYIPEDAKIVA